ncbi:MAG TPA: FAD-dependent oxidoreductase [Gaiellaceae bacterium]|nr:FAD-dependent oxidoreductase [Gaiellaceae bacterium]
MSDRIVVVGGGIVGCATAYYAARDGADVTLVEREHVAFGASGRNPGFVWLHCRNPGIALELSLASRRLYPELVEELPEDFGFLPNGGLIYFTAPEQRDVFAEFVEARRRDGLEMELLDGADVRRLVPPIREDVLGASFCPLDAQIDTPRFVRALAAGARAQGAKIREGISVTGLRRDGDRVAGVDTSDGAIAADTVVVAAGAWTPPLLETVDVEVKIGGERLQVLSTEPLPRMIEPLVYGPLATKQYALFRDLPSYDVADFTAPYEDEADIELLLLASQRATGEILLGCPMDYPAELDQRPTFAGLAAIVHGFELDFPGLRNVPISRMWAGLLPYTSDTLPIIDASIDGLVIASGHVYGNSAGPITGKLVAQLVTGREPEIDLHECALDRGLTLPEAGTAARW